MDSAGIELKELDYSNYVQSIADISVGCIGEAKRGPLEPTLITSQKQLIDIYGEPTEGQYGLYGAYCALFNVNKLWYQRIVGSGDKALAGQVGVDKLIYNMINTGEIYNNYKINQVVSEDGSISLTLFDSEDNELETYEGLSDDETSEKYIVSVLDKDSVYINVEIDPTGVLESKELTFEGGVEGASIAVAGDDTTEFCLKSKYPDSTINGCRFILGESDNFGYFNAKLVDASGNDIEVYTNVTRNDKDERYITRLINNTSGRIQVYTNINFDGNSANDNSSYVFKNGRDGMSTITDSDIIGSASECTGMQAFNNSESMEINLLIIPGNTSSAVNSAAVELVTERGDTVYIADTPKGLSAQEAVNYANGEGVYQGNFIFNSSYAAMYYPWVGISDPFTKKTLLLPPSGIVVAQYAHSDSKSYPWFAPAGLNRGVISNVVVLEKNLNKGERDILYGNRNCINPIVRFTGSGIVIWGQKTTQRKSSALDRVNVRRLMNYLKKMIGEASRYFIFEMNDQITWNQWIDMVETNLNNVKHQRGIYDMQIEMHPTSAEVDNYQMPGTIKIKPSKAAEFINLNFMIMPTGANFDETNV